MGCLLPSYSHVTHAHCQRKLSNVINSLLSLQSVAKSAAKSMPTYILYFMLASFPKQRFYIFLNEYKKQSPSKDYLDLCLQVLCIKSQSERSDLRDVVAGNVNSTESLEFHFATIAIFM